ncbi:hypothetical protein ROHU_021349 [Labeo rohita]|uniref:Uncharacterized protein n=1 Tax=Labeo rohita TaxID=84645 RepID=A0A498N0L5_LABRO|nr:hypothetical protein ROHU_021349 [Labeo rohita]
MTLKHTSELPVIRLSGKCNVATRGDEMKKRSLLACTDKRALATTNSNRVVRVFSGSSLNMFTKNREYADFVPFPIEMPYFQSM